MGVLYYNWLSIEDKIIIHSRPLAEPPLLNIEKGIRSFLCMTNPTIILVFRYDIVSRGSSRVK